jgi:uncharacterized MnhB-related membrane protein
MFLSIIEVTVSTLLVVLAFLAISAKSLIKTVLFLSTLSMLAVLAFIIMQAPDVAITEAVIGSGLVTSLFVFTLLSTRKEVKKS